MNNKLKKKKNSLIFLSGISFVGILSENVSMIYILEKCVSIKYLLPSEFYPTNKKRLMIGFNHKYDKARSRI
jgi:hypothetical protein